MARIRCNYEGCIHLEKNFCTAGEVELDQELGCLTFSQVDEEEVEAVIEVEEVAEEEEEVWDVDEDFDDEEEDEDLTDWEDDEDEDEDEESDTWSGTRRRR